MKQSFWAAKTTSHLLFPSPADDSAIKFPVGVKDIAANPFAGSSSNSVAWSPLRGKMVWLSFCPNSSIRGACLPAARP